MLLAVVVLWLGAIVSFAPAVFAQSGPYIPYFFYISMNSVKNLYHLSSVLDNDGNIYLWQIYDALMTIHAILETTDYLHYRVSKVHSRLTEDFVMPLFIVYDKGIASFGNDYLIGFKIEDTDSTRISWLLDVNSPNALLCKDCITPDFTCQVATSWDTERKRWVSIITTSTGTGFAVSSDLKVWVTKKFLPDDKATVLESAIEIFPIADDNDANKVTWILIRKSNTQPSVLLYDTFVPDDANPQYKEMGVLDGSMDWFDFAIVSSNSTNYQHRNVVAGKRVEYWIFGVPHDVFMSFRTLSFSDGKLRQLPISSAFPTPKFEQEFPYVVLTRGVSVFSSLPSSVSLTIEAELKPVKALEFGFDFFISETSRKDFAVSLAINHLTKTISLTRNPWFAAGPIAPNDTSIQLTRDFEPDGSNLYKILIAVDSCSVEYFLQDGLYVGSIFTFPQADMKRHDVFACGRLDISNMIVRIFN